MRKIIGINVAWIVLWILGAGSAVARTGSGGQAGPLLRLGTGARELGMGGALVSVTNDVYSVYWNPAGLTQLEGPEMTFALRSMSLDRDNYSAGYGRQIEPDGAFGILWLHGGTEIQGRDTSGRKTEQWLDSDNAVYVAFGRKVREQVSVGVAMKVLRHTLGGQDAKGFGFDLGMQAQPWPHIALGLAIQHLGAKMSWQTDLWDQATSREDQMPVSVVMGTSCRLFARRLMISVDGFKTGKADIDINAGVELAPNEMIAVRIGTRGIFNEEDRTWGAGLSLRTSIRSRAFRLDYAYVTDPLDAGDSQIVSVTVGL